MLDGTVWSRIVGNDEVGETMFGKSVWFRVGYRCLE